MNSIIHLSVSQLRRAASLKQKIQSLENQLSKLLGGAETATNSAPKKRRKISAAGRKRIAEAQKLRWSKAKGRKSAVKPVKKVRRKMSAEARKKIADAAKKRWATAKAAGKK